MLGVMWTAAEAETLPGRCVSVSDGDTMRIQLANRERVRIRLWGIDAPEKGQAFGEDARETLNDLIYRKDVRVEVEDTDQYGRKVGRVYVGDVYVNEHMVRQGMAWHYEYHAPDAGDLAAAQQAARLERAGLWQDDNAISPYEYRKANNTKDGDREEAQEKPRATQSKTQAPKTAPKKRTPKSTKPIQQSEAKADVPQENSLELWKGIGIGILVAAAGALVIFLSSHKKKRRKHHFIPKKRKNKWR